MPRKGNLPLQLKVGWSQDHVFFLSVCTYHLAEAMGRVTGIAQKSKVNKTLAFWVDEQKGEHPGKTRKHQRDQGEKRSWENP